MTFNKIIVSDSPPNLIQEGQVWRKPIIREYINGEISFCYSGGEWCLLYDNTNVTEMIELLSLFGEVKIKRTVDNKYFCCFLLEGSALWFYNTSQTIDGSLDGLIYRCLELNIIKS